MVTIGKESQSRVDWLLMLAIGGLMAVGVAFVYSATMAHESSSITPWHAQFWVRQVIWCKVSL